MNTAEVSVVIPLFNKGAYVGRAIDSVLAQTCGDFEIIVVDDGSTDDGPEVVRERSDSRLFLVRQPNSGVSAARNRGIAEAQGDLVAFLDADDAWAPEFLATILKLRNRYPTAGGYATAYEVVLQGGQRKLPGYHGIPVSGWEGILANYFASATYGAPPLCASSVAIPKTVFEAVGQFPLGKRMGEDLDMWGRIAFGYPVAFSSSVQALYYKDAENRACTSFHLGDEHPFIETAEKLLSASGSSAAGRQDVMRYVAKLKLENVRQYVLAGEYRQARQLAEEIVEPQFKLRKFIWGGRHNAMTHLLWKMLVRHGD